MTAPPFDPALRTFVSGLDGRYALAVVSSSSCSEIEPMLEAGGLRQFFRLVVTGHEVTHPKPHPEIYLHTAGLLDVPPDACVVFEDSCAGVQAGLDAGMRVVGVTTTHEDLPGVALLIRDFNDPGLEPWLAGSMDA